MTAPNLTRDAAVERAQTITVTGYAVDLDLTDGSGGPGERTFASTTTVTFDATAGASTFIDLVADSVESATLNGTELDVSGYDPEHGIDLPDLAAQNELTVVARCLYSNTGEGLHRFVDPSDGAVYLYSQFETADAKRMFACFDQPDLKSTFTIGVTAPQDWQVITNAAPVETLASEPGVHRFRPTEPMSTYLVALIAGPYARWEDTYSDDHGTIPLGIYCRASLSEHMDPERVFTETKQGFEFYHRNFGVPYAFGKYDQLFVPEFNAGAMENAGAVTYLEDYVFRSKVTKALYERRAETILHEMAHMWFGDLVTMRWWDDLWLNESFATFASVLCQSEATEYTTAWTTFATVDKSWAYRQDQLPSTHPVAADIPDIAAVEVNFDGITYAKGASVLKQLVAYVGLEDFLAGLRDYFTAHRFGNATFADLVGALERSSGRDLSDWGDTWLRTTGITGLRPEFTVDDSGAFSSFTVVQTGAEPGAGETRMHRIAIGVYDDEDGKLVRAHRVELDVEGERTDVPDLVGVPRGALVLLNDDDLTYCTIGFDDDSWRVATERIADITESLPRTLVWSAAWEQTRAATMRPRDFVELVLRGIGAETEIAVVQRVLMQAQTAIDRYADPEWAVGTGWPRFSRRMLELARDAEAGSDHQLAFVGALLSGLVDDDVVAVLRSLLDGDDPASVGLPGLVVDTDLRWSVLTALATAGAVDEDPDSTPVIDAEAQRDNTAAGARKAETARAARPLAEAKKNAWDRVVTDDSLSNTVGRAIIAGFARPGQEHLLEPYVEKYFDAVADVWRRRSSEVAQSVVIGLYPQWAIDDDALSRADEFLTGDHPPALRRLVLEGRDTVARSLRIRRADRGEG
ncbi:aminopeptidase N [Williamsia serinedens]|uniref:Aminopeptidase N n=1 Tax=Williamsia serinedens TaxID=391736 RepID=A0ABT1GZD2_9NOCA|nr:aminopeptidase N [Williamsia serinedens]MCP2158902.1 aminopeptidase N [Williamsia serinedens]